MNRMDEIYGEGYFHGVNSGYPRDGYESGHPDWTVHLDCLLNNIPANARMLDVGCAYGYFVEQAVARGYDAVGIDVSRYAVSRKPDLAERLRIGDACRLPFPASRFDVLTAFDILEHLPDPLPALVEWKRVLKPSGLLLISTPDPVKFTAGYEQTHLNERPPSYWIKVLSNMGFDWRFWFYETLFLEIVACPGTGNGQVLDAIHRAFLSKRQSTLKPFNEAGGISLAPRGPWKNEIPSKTLYLLNRTGAGISCRLLLEGEGVQGLVIDCSNPLVMAAPHDDPPAGPVEDQSAQWQIQVPPMGIELALTDVNGKGITPKQISVAGTKPWEPDFRILSGDHWSRHQTVLDYLRKLGIPEGSRILDMGGGDSLMPLMAPEFNWTVVDLYGSDHPSFLRRKLLDPFGDETRFDAVVSTDVLEHVPREERERFLERACSLSAGPVIISAPFDSAIIRTVESLFAQSMTQLHEDGHKFIEDHVRLGLPELEGTAKLLREMTGQCAVLPGESVLFWWQSTFYYLALKEMAPSAGLSALFARLQSESARSRVGEPCYRRCLIAWNDPRLAAMETGTAKPGEEPSADKIVDECLRMASLGALYQARRNTELSRQRAELSNQNLVLNQALQASQAELARVMEEWRKLLANYDQAAAERDAYHAKYRRLRDFLVTIYQIIPLKWLLPLGPIDPKSGEFRLK